MNLQILMLASLALLPGGMAGAYAVDEPLETRRSVADPGVFSRLDPRNQISDAPLERAFYYFKKNRNVFHNRRYIGVIDFTRSALERRFFVVDLKSGAVESFAVAHGKGSDPVHKNRAGRFSNKLGSNATSLGFYRTAEVYYGDHGRSLRLDGLSTTNSNARDRDIVIHAAWYVTGSTAFGRSNGCFAVDEKVRNRIVDKLGGGAMIYAYGGQASGFAPQRVASK